MASSEDKGERMAETQLDQVREASDDAEATVDDLQERSERVGEGIQHAKKRWDDAQKSEDVPSAAGDWEDTEPDDSTGEDPAGFDDPEADEDDEDLDADDE
jgi:capsule polysaccharide export protein KpsE/RkpR